jgi:hypothetical protein
MEQKSIQTYASCLNHIQPKNKFIPPPLPLKITNLKLSTQKCKPDKKIQTDQPTIQIQASDVNIYDQRGNYMATIATLSLCKFWGHNNFTMLQLLSFTKWFFY